MLKFKAKNPVSHKYIDNFKIIINNGNVVAIREGETDFTNKVKMKDGSFGHEKLILHQFIGICDIHGEPIYGGHGCNGDYIRVKTQSGFVREGYVVYSGYYPSWVIKTSDSIEYYINRDDPIEIIDNPEQEEV